MREKILSLTVCGSLMLATFAVMDVVFDDHSSVNASKGWSNSIRLTYSSGDSTTPDMAVWGSNVHVVWSDNRNGNYEIYYKRSTDNGLTWGNDVRLTFTGNNDINPHITVFGNNIHIVWGADATCYINSTDNGDNWGNIKVWDWTSYPYCYPDDLIIYPDVTADCNSVYIVALAWGPDDVIFKRSSDNGGTWTDWIKVEEFSWWCSRLSIETDGWYLHIIEWRPSGSGLSIWHYYSDDYGENWWDDVNNPIIYFGGPNEYGLETFATSMQGGTLRVAYSVGHPLPLRINTTCLICPPDYWNGPFEVGYNGEGNVDVDNDHIVWEGKDTNNYHQLYSNKYGQITNFPSDSFLPSISSSGNIVHIIWVDNRDGNNELYYSQRGLFPDLYIPNSNIQFSPSSPAINGTAIYINAKVISYGKSASNVDVKFYDGNPDTNNDLIPDPTALEIGNDTININKDSSALASTQWLPTSVGDYNIYVWADPNNDIKEYDTTNNLANNALKVTFMDLALSNSNIQFCPSAHVLSSTTITIDANVSSYLGSVSNVEVKFYNGNPDADNDLIPDPAAVEIGNDTIDIAKDSSSIASTHWVPLSAGAYNIYVWIDAVNAHLESNESNNLARNTIFVFHWMDTFDNSIRTESRQNIAYYNGDTILSLHYYFDFNTSDGGFVLESNQPYSRICWDSMNGNVQFRANNHDPKDEMFIKPLFEALNENGSSWTLSARFMITERGRWQNAIPLFIGDSSITGIVNSPNTISFEHVSEPGELRARYMDSAGNRRIYISYANSLGMEYHVKAIYDNTTKNLTIQFRDKNDVVLTEGSFLIGTNPSDGFTFGKIGIGTDGWGGILDSVCKGWTDDIALIGSSNESGLLVSTPITLPPDHAWSTFYINKTEPSNTFINVTIIDATSGEPIPGFIDLTGNIINLTGLDPILYPSIKLVANFTGSDIASPKLHLWALNWDALPFSMPLYNGWNLISIPRIPSNTSLQSVLQSLDGQYDAVQWYDTTDLKDPWKHYHISKPSYMNDLSKLDLKMGFWVHITATQGTLFILQGTKPTTTQLISLHSGWNLVGYPAITNRLRDDALNNLAFGTDIDLIQTFNAATQKWEEIEEFDYLEMGRGYWIHAKHDCDWLVLSPIWNRDKNQYYYTIQDAINNADPYDTIEIPPGVYNEALVISKPIALLGKNNQTIEIVGNNNPVVEIFANNVTLDNLCLSGGSYGIYITNSKGIQIQNNVISDYKLVGIYAHNSSINISNNHITNDPSSTGGAGIRLIECKDSLIEYNTIEDIVYSVYLMYSSATIRNNLISPTDGFDDRLDSIGIALYHKSNAIVFNNVVYGGDVGIGIEYGSCPVIEGNEIASSGYYGIYIKNFGSPSLYNNKIINCCGYGIFSNYGMSVNITNNTLHYNDVMLCNSTIANLWLTSGCATSATAINTSIANYQVHYWQGLTVEWYLHVKVVNLTNDPIPGALVEIKDNSNGTFDGTYITGPDGYAGFIAVTEFWQNDLEKIYYTPHNITASIGSSIGYAEPRPWVDASVEVAIVLDYP